MKKRILVVSTIAVGAGLIWGLIYINSLLPIITGYPAKYLSAAVFISGRDPKMVTSTDLHFSLIQYAGNEINYGEKSVTSRFLWGKSKAIYRDGFGTVLLRDTDEATLRAQKFPDLAACGYNQDTIPWPLGNIIPDANTGIDELALDKVTQKLMLENSYGGNAFGFIVVHKGVPVAEKYNHGFNDKTRLLSWSMAKSFTNSLAGIMTIDGKLDIHQPAGIDAWQQDERKHITINDLLQMQSGLQWNEDYGNRSDVTLMLYNNHDFAAYASGKRLEYPAGSHWYYSSGSTNIVNYLMRKQFSDDGVYHAYALTRLFYKIGMPDAIFETDPAGTQVGSSYLFATLRDYARFGLLYLQDGNFNGERILPNGWVKYSTTPASQSHQGYGSCFWLNKAKYYPSAPDDMYSCNGHDGQRIFIIPSKELIVVVVGYSPSSKGGMNFDQLLGDILATMP
jgi:hypothetical protein